ncbi:relaxase MobL [Nocardiopsis synnemataformans]|uniref:relaxase MobL n=1 Tax=Nocardiopsis synnemataformans TaxID=61305 RepID=UPI003EBD80E9
MGLKQDVVIVNEYSVPLPSFRRSGGPRGSRGSTPGAYVLRYMAREAATETMTPIRRRHTDHFLERYMAREHAAESTDVDSPGLLKKRIARAQGLGGVAFGYGATSMSHDQLKAAASDVQHLFDLGHTVMKTVISFTPEFLRRHGLVPTDFEPGRRGDYQGQVDQMKLRMAIMHGLHRLGQAQYDELRYVGVIQIDTKHVHCHLAMVDAGHGTRAADGTQKGKITARARALLRRGVDTFLHQKRGVAHLSSAISYERRNVVTFVKRWAHQQMLREALPQFLLACLPENRRLWRLGTDRLEMRKPDRIAREMVEEVLSRDGSPMSAAIEQLRKHLDHQVQSEGMDARYRRALEERGRERLVEQGVSAVYALMRQLPQKAFRVRTPLLDAMSMNYEDLAARVRESEDSHGDIVRFGFRLRSYSTRLNHHTAQREQAHRSAREWESADSIGMASVSSRALYRFWQEEEEYHARLTSKYRSFLPFTPPTAVWHEPLARLTVYKERLLSLEAMRNDQVLRRAKDPDEAERIGYEVYSQAGGHLVSLGNDASLARFDERIHTMRIEYDRNLMDLRVELAGRGLVLEVISDGNGGTVPRVSAGVEYPFEEVKGLDLHHLRYDFPRDVVIGDKTKAEFVVWAQRRSEALDEAIAYLEGSGQAELISELPMRDIQAMGQLVREIDEIERRGEAAVLASGMAELMHRSEPIRRSPTVMLSERLSEQIMRRVDEAVYPSAAAMPREGVGLQQR